MPTQKTFFFLVASFFLIFLLTPKTTHAFQYAPLPSGNLIQNPWFRGSTCNFSGLGWETNTDAPWGGSKKIQDPTDVNCDGQWTGFAARFADNQGATPEFYPNKNAYLWQVVGPVSPTATQLSFHALFVAHRVNQYKAEIYGGNSPNGPWTSVWTPWNIQNCLTFDCVNNSPPNGVCNGGNRQCLWAEVTEYFLGTLNPLTKTIPTGFSYYKIEFLMNYPTPDSTATGDVGGKLVRVFFKVAGGAALPSPSPSPSTPPGFEKGDVNHNGLTNTQDVQIILTNLTKLASQVPGYFDAFIDGKINMLDFGWWKKDF